MILLLRQVWRRAYFRTSRITCLSVSWSLRLTSSFGFQLKTVKITPYAVLLDSLCMIVRDCFEVLVKRVQALRVFQQNKKPVGLKIISA